LCSSGIFDVVYHDAVDVSGLAIVDVDVFVDFSIMSNEVLHYVSKKTPPTFLAVT